MGSGGYATLDCSILTRRQSSLVTIGAYSRWYHRSLLRWTLTLESSVCRYSERLPAGFRGVGLESGETLRGKERVHEEHVHEVMSMGTQDEYMLMDLYTHLSGDTS